ncbi:hypothetical protein F5877DRAFT_37777 [Lentinula edodes]|nr:hypothetical protein F5877DRAFT_37777 [Lentinula edodes]
MLSQPYELSERIIEKMEAGEDNRTSLKIRHVPHSVTIDQLEEMIENIVGPRKIDFLHLPRFKNGDNVGYGFVNFIHMKDLVSFVKKTENIKYPGTKTEVQLGIATVQTKEKFVRRYCINKLSRVKSTVPQEWQPRLFHSTGPQQGLPEDLPGLEDPQYILSSPQIRKYEVVQEALAGNIGNLLKEKPGDVTGLDLGDFF